MAMKDYIPLNLPLMANPVNWLIVALIVALGIMALTFVFNAGNIAKESENGE